MKYKKENLLTKIAQNSAFEVDKHESYTGEHSQKVTLYSANIANYFKTPLSDREKKIITVSASLHDIGKLDWPIEVINATKFTPQQREKYQFMHPIDGERRVRQLLGIKVAKFFLTPFWTEQPLLEYRDEICRNVRCHHERIDGTGYPDGLKGKEIPLASRIIAVADTFQAITSPRSYQRERTPGEAIEIIREERGKQLDEDAVDAMIRFYESESSKTSHDIGNQTLPMKAQRSNWIDEILKKSAEGANEQEIRDWLHENTIKSEEQREKMIAFAFNKPYKPDPTFERSNLTKGAVGVTPHADSWTVIVDKVKGKYHATDLVCIQIPPKKEEFWQIHNIKGKTYNLKRCKKTKKR